MEANDFESVRLDVCMCMCVYERQQETERQRDQLTHDLPPPLPD